MGCSKFDDYKRTLWREVGKSFFYLPYCGGISSGKRARDYMRFLGIPEGKIQTEYNTVSIERICKLAGVDPAPGGPAFEERHFTIIARFIPKKNIAMALEAFELYRRDTPRCHSLHICGSGPLEADLKHRAAELGILQDIVFHGFVQTEDIARVLGSTLALLLPSVEEQFGNVVIEAQALGIPVILSDNCGARDVLVRSGVNGFVIEPDNPQGLAYFMNTVSTDRRVWESLALSARRSGTFGDVKQFALATQMLVGSAAKLIPSLGSQGGD
jgi:glycosyltransferase involved in cell wall biosynthesis